MTRPRKFTPDQEEEAYLVKTLGLANMDFYERMGISHSLVSRILPGRIGEWGSRIAEHIEQIEDKSLAQVGFYFSGHRPPGYIPVNMRSKAHKGVHAWVSEKVFDPALEQIVDNISLNEYVANERSEILLKLLGETNSHGFFIAREEFLDTVDQMLLENDYDLKRAAAITQENISNKVIRGGAAWTSLKTAQLTKLLSGLGGEERSTIALRLGTNGDAYTQSDLARYKSVSRQSVETTESRVSYRSNTPVKKEIIHGLLRLEGPEVLGERESVILDLEVRAQLRDEVLQTAKAELFTELFVQGDNGYELDEQKVRTYLAAANSLESDQFYRLAQVDIKDLGLSNRTSNIFRTANISTVAELSELKASEFLRFKGAGSKCFKEVKDAMQKLGVNWP